jgi:hypothetical protein
MNVARGKAVTQSTSNPSFDNSLAVDGVRTGENFSTTVPGDLNPYLEVDLGEEYAIEQIKDFTRDNCCSPERDYNITFEILTQTEIPFTPVQFSTHGTELAAPTFWKPALYCKWTSLLSWDKKITPSASNTLETAEVIWRDVGQFNNGSEGQNLRYLWIEYDGATHQLAVYFSSNNTKPPSPTINASVDMKALFGSSTESLSVGWTSQNFGTNTNTFDVLNWGLRVPVHEEAGWLAIDPAPLPYDARPSSQFTTSQTGTG